MVQIGELSANMTPLNINQMTRWVNTKEVWGGPEWTHPWADIPTHPPMQNAKGDVLQNPLSYVVRDDKRSRDVWTRSMPARSWASCLSTACASAWSLQVIQRALSPAMLTTFRLCRCCFPDVWMFNRNWRAIYFDGFLRLPFQSFSSHLLKVKIWKIH